MRGHVPAAVARLQAKGVLAATNRLHLAIGLPLRNEAALDDLLGQLYDPASPNYRKYLTPEQFTEQFGPTESDYQKVITFARANGLTVTSTYGNRVLLDVSGTADNIQKAFQVTLRVYQHPREPRIFFAPDVEPSVETNLPILDISGLNNFELPHPKNLKFTPAIALANATPRSGSGSGGTYIGNDFRAAYVPGISLDGTGQTVGLLEFDGYYSGDITSYESQAGLANIPLQNVPVSGGVSTPGSGNIEVALDIEMAISMAPNLSAVVIFEAPNTGTFNSLLNTMVSSNQIKQLSCSWGGGGPNASSENIFKNMAAQ
ncbi:MAG TPA: protease pro-enzyme activation domain-containing protein, partial [Verrucomicrobiae bacterium]